MEIKGFERYTVTKEGLVHSIRADKLLKHSPNHAGYYRVSLYKDKKKYDKFIHRLIAEHYIPNPDNKPFIDHINRIRTDNRIENLRWVTHQENCNNQSLRSDNKLRETGIHFSPAKYIYEWREDGKRKSKKFSTFEEAKIFKYSLLN
tara:strand:+ start:82 stop:522 length:441 start_codon:yes stop_codon:yes gene_type:complete